MGWIKGCSGGQTTWTNTETRETWISGCSGGQKTWHNTSTRDTWISGCSGGQRTWNSTSRNPRSSFQAWMDEDDD